MNSIPCDIVILPTPELTKEAIASSIRLEQYGTLFILQNDTYVPHVSLYMTQLKISSLAKAKELLADIATRTSTLSLVATDYSQTEGYIDADYLRTNEIAHLQMRVIDAINPIRDGMREKDKTRMLAATGKVRENLKKYGYRGVGELFRPHMTLTRFDDSKAIDTGTLSEPSQFSGQFIKLGLFEMGDNGTCVRKIAEFKLEGKVYV